MHAHTCTCTHAHGVKNKLLLLPYPLHIGVVNSQSTSYVHGLQEDEPCHHEPSAKQFSQHIFIDYFLKDFLNLFLERGEGKDKERERNINVWLPLAHPLQGPGL